MRKSYICLSGYITVGWVFGPSVLARGLEFIEEKTMITRRITCNRYYTTISHYADANRSIDNRGYCLFGGKTHTPFRLHRFIASYEDECFI